VGLALVSVGVATAGDRRLYVTGGQQLDRDFLSTLVLPAGMRVLLYRNLAAEFSPAELVDTKGPVHDWAALKPLIDEARSSGRELTRTVGIENVRALPLTGERDHVLGVLLIASSRQQLMDLESSLLWTGIAVAGTGILVGLALALWATARVTRPV